MSLIRQVFKENELIYMEHLYFIIIYYKLNYYYNIYLSVF